MEEEGETRCDCKGRLWLDLDSVSERKGKERGEKEVLRIKAG